MHKRLDALDLLRKGLGAGGLSSLPPLWEGKGGGKGLLVDAFPSNGSHKDPKYWGEEDESPGCPRHSLPGILGNAR